MKHRDWYDTSLTNSRIYNQKSLWFKRRREYGVIYMLTIGSGTATVFQETAHMEQKIPWFFKDSISKTMLHCLWQDCLCINFERSCQINKYHYHRSINIINWTRWIDLMLIIIRFAYNIPFTSQHENGWCVIRFHSLNRAVGRYFIWGVGGETKLDGCEANFCDHGVLICTVGS